MAKQEYIDRLVCALELIAVPDRPDVTYNRDREACRQIALQALHRLRRDIEEAKGKE